MEWHGVRSGGGAWSGASDCGEACVNASSEATLAAGVNTKNGRHAQLQSTVAPLRLHRGDILRNMPDGHLVALDAVVKQAWVISRVQAPPRRRGTPWLGPQDKSAAVVRVERGAGEYAFVPLSAQPSGCFGGAAMAFLGELGDVTVARNPRVCRSSFVRWALLELSCSLCTGNARIYAAARVRLLQRAGTAV